LGNALKPAQGKGYSQYTLKCSPGKGFSEQETCGSSTTQTHFPRKCPSGLLFSLATQTEKYFCCFQKASKFVHVKNSKNYTMNKAELIAKIADDAEITKTQANSALDSFIEAVTKTLKGNGKVTLVGFGTFSVSKRAARNGRNPQTGEVIKIKAKKVARFKAGKELTAKL
jgi:DNA-binding protein HU-beta